MKGIKVAVEKAASGNKSEKNAKPAGKGNTLDIKRINLQKDPE